jgi:hypothetical protein
VCTVGLCSFVTYLATLWYQNYVPTDDRMTDDLERTWEETVVA